MKMVRWIAHAMYRPETRSLLWRTHEATAPMWSKWRLPHEDPYPHSTERGHLIHTLPWGTPYLPHEWSALSSHVAMTPFRQFPDRGRAFATAINYYFLSKESMPLRGTVDLALAHRDLWVGVELKSGMWRYAASWDSQLKRHLTDFPQVLLTLVNPHAARGSVPTMVLCTN